MAAEQKLLLNSSFRWNQIWITLCCAA